MLLNKTLKLNLDLLQASLLNTKRLQLRSMILSEIRISQNFPSYQQHLLKNLQLQYHSGKRNTEQIFFMLLQFK